MSKKDISLGRCLIKNHKKKTYLKTKDGHRHSCDLPDGRDWGRLNLQSVTEQTSLQTFLETAELADKEYEEEFSNIKIVTADTSNGILTADEKLLVKSAQERNKSFLCIPRRPVWNQDTQKSELDANEKLSYLDWRRTLSKLKDEEHINMTPYETNLEIWRQLWRVIERSHVLVQILDARNPLLFRCPDLESYVKEVDSSKLNVLLLNKAELLTESERECWCRYFESIGVKIVFFSALQQMERPTEEDSDTEDPTSPLTDEQSEDDSPCEQSEDDSPHDQSENNSPCEPSEDSSPLTCEQREDAYTLNSNKQSESDCNESVIKNSSKILSREELIVFLKEIGSQVASTESGGSVIGLVGYPNVGKSSTINAVLMSKKVTVSSTPGKTKHFQTLIIDKDLCFCDCPGLVFPNFVSTKAEMIINGILPIHQLTNWAQPISLITNLIPRRVLEVLYNILIPLPGEGKDPKSPPTAEEFMTAYGYSKGYMTERGIPDNARCSRFILTDFVSGKLLYCHAPPGILQEDFHKFVVVGNKKKSTAASTNETEEKDVKVKITEADRKFFMPIASAMHVKGCRTPYGKMSVDPNSMEHKPWKKHHNKNKNAKLRRIYKNPYD